MLILDNSRNENIQRSKLEKNPKPHHPEIAAINDGKHHCEL